MNILLPFSFINNYNENKSKLAFGTAISKKHTVADDIFGMKSQDLTNVTYFFRDGFSDKFADSLIQHFPQGIKIYDYACSDGTEAYSIALSLIERLGERQAGKYFPVEARDLSQECINQAQKGLIEIEKEEIEEIESKIRNTNFNEFFKQTCQKNTFQIQERLKKCVNFKKQNFVRDAIEGNFSKNPCILIFKNAYQHINHDAQVNLLNYLYENPGFPSGSIVILSGSKDIIKPDKLKIPIEKFVPLDEKFKKVELLEDGTPQSGCYIFKKL